MKNPGPKLTLQGRSKRRVLASYNSLAMELSRRLLTGLLTALTGQDIRTTFNHISIIPDARFIFIASPDIRQLRTLHPSGIYAT